MLFPAELHIDLLILLLKMLQRVYHDKLPIQGNVYPMACAAYIEDATHRVTILSRQPLGVTGGDKPGEIRVFLDRRMMQDDNRGLSESINDNVPTRSLFRILVEKIWHSPGAQVSARIFTSVCLCQVEEYSLYFSTHQRFDHLWSHLILFLHPSLQTHYGLALSIFNSYTRLCWGWGLLQFSVICELTM